MAKTLSTGITLGLAIAGLFNAIENLPVFGAIVATLWLGSALRALKQASK